MAKIIADPNTAGVFLHGDGFIEKIPYIKKKMTRPNIAWKAK